MVEVPFELVDDHVFVRASVNGAAADLIVDTGSSVSSLSETFAARIGVKLLDGIASVAGAARMPVRLATVRSISLPRLDLGEAVVALITADGVSRAAGRTIDGTLGFELFHRYAVEIDYARQRLVAHPPSEFAPAGVLALPVETAKRIPLIEATIETRPGARVRAKLVIDLGSSAFSLRLAASFVERHRSAFGGVTGVAAPIGAGVGGRLMGEIVRLHALQLGELSIAAPTAGLAREKKGALEIGLFDGSIGVPVLAPWFAADYPNGRIFLLRDAPRVSRCDASGLTLTTDAERVVVDFVADRSPAAEAGIAPGDIVDNLDGEEVTARDLPRLRRAFREAETTRVLHVRRLGSVPIALRTLV
jgi:hypothetical protein